MKQRPSLAFMIGSGVAVLLIVGAAVLAALGFVRQRAIARQLAQRKVDLARFYELDPFPSMANVEQEAVNQRELDLWFNKLMQEVASGQLRVEDLSPATFATVLGQKYRKLVAAAAGKTQLPDKFHFGFDRYFAAGAKLPQREHVPRLMQQITIIETISEILFASGCRQINSVEREGFEGSGTTRGGSARGSRFASRDVDSNVGLILDGEHFAKLHFGVSFEATEKSTLEALNALVRHDLFCVVRRLSFSKSEDDVRTPLEAAPGRSDADTGEVMAGPGATEMPSRARRMVCGIAMEVPVMVELDLDVYRFREVATK